MAKLTSTNFLSAVRATLDGDSTDWPDAILNAAQAQMASDMERFGLPCEALYDLTLSFSVDDEGFDSGFDVAVSLANSPLEASSETVTSEDGATTYTRDTDYTMDYVNGTITVLSTGDMEDATGYLISYNKDKRSFSLSILGAFINIDTIEYPAGQTPMRFCNWEIFGDQVILTTRDGDNQSQQNLAEGYHVVIRYTKKHTLPTADAGGTWDEYMDYVAVLGTSAYAMLFRALAHMQYGRESLESNTDLWSDFDDRITEALAYLTTGEPFIPSVNVGADVPANYGNYAEIILKMASELRSRAEIYAGTGVAAYQMASALISAAESRLSKFRSEVISRANARMNKFQASPTQFSSGD